MVALRPILPEDRERILDILTSDQISKTYILPDFENREAAEPLFQRLMEMSRNKGRYVRGITAGNELVGFLNHTDIQNRKIELGYVIHPDFQGQGYMTAALRLAMEELFSLRYEEIITGAFSTNTASIRVMEKCGMIRLRNTDEIEYRGTVHTCVYYRKIQE